MLPRVARKNQAKNRNSSCPGIGGGSQHPHRTEVLSPNPVPLYLSDLIVLYLPVFSFLVPAHLLLPLWPLHVTSADSQLLLPQHLSQHHGLSSFSNTLRHFSISSQHYSSSEISWFKPPPPAPTPAKKKKDNLLTSEWIVCVWVTSFFCSLSDHSCIKKSLALNNSSLKERQRGSVCKGNQDQYGCYYVTR